MGNELSQGGQQVKIMEKFKGYSPKQIFLIREKFDMMADEDLCLNVDDFSRLMKTNQQETKQIFECFDQDGSGTIDSFEFLICICLLSHASINQKCEIVFALYDFDKSQNIKNDELVVLIKSCINGINNMNSKPETSIFQAEKFCKEILSKYDKNNDGEISLAEFKRFVTTDVHIVEYLLAFNIINRDDLRKDFGGNNQLAPDVDSDFEAELDLRKVILDERVEQIKLGNENPLQSQESQNTTAQTYFAPSDFQQKNDQAVPPEVSLQMQFVYGYRSYDVRNNLHYDKEKNIVYHTAAIGIVYNTKDKKRPQKFYLDHSDDIICCDIFENKVATGQIGCNPLLCIWNSSTQQNICIIRGDLRQGIKYVNFSNDGLKIVAISTDKDQTIAIYDIEMRSKNPEPYILAIGKGPQEEILAVKFDINNRTLVIACNQAIYFASFENEQITLTKGQFSKNPCALTCIGFCESNIITGTFNGELITWKSKKEWVRQQAHNGPVTCLIQRKMANQKGLLTAGIDGVIKFWNNDLKEEKVERFTIHQETKNLYNSKVRSLCESVEGNLLIGTRDGHIIELNQGQPDIHMKSHYNGSLNGLSVSNQDGSSYFYTVGDDRLLCQWDLQQYKQIKCMKLKSSSDTICVSYDGRKIAVGCQNGQVQVYDTNNNGQNFINITTIRQESSKITCVKFSEKGLLAGYFKICYYKISYNKIFYFKVVK